MINTFPLALAANVELVLDVAPSTCFSLQTASSSIKVRFDETSNWLPVRQGDDIGPAPREFTKITLLSTSSQNVTVLVGDTEVRQSTSVNVNATATVESANTCVALADVTITAGNKLQVCGANANRKEVVIKSRSVNTDNVRLGNNATVDAAHGNELEPGESATYATEAAIYAHNTGSTSVTLTVTELERV